MVKRLSLILPEISTMYVVSFIKKDYLLTGIKVYATSGSFSITNNTTTSSGSVSTARYVQPLAVGTRSNRKQCDRQYY